MIGARWRSPATSPAGGGFLEESVGRRLLLQVQRRNTVDTVDCVLVRLDVDTLIVRTLPRRGADGRPTRPAIEAVARRDVVWIQRPPEAQPEPDS